MNKNFWQAKSVLITGSEGFLGSNLTRALIHSGARVVGLDIKAKRSNAILDDSDYRRMKSVYGSVTDLDLLKKIVKNNKIKVIFHLAAEAIVSKSQKDPLSTFKTNILGTCNLLETARLNSGVEAVIVASSDKAYGAHKKLPYTEEIALQGNHPYDVSKSCVDLIASTYAHAYGLSVAITRCGNIYGPGDTNFSRIVPDALRCALSGEELLIRSDGKFTRDYIFVNDAVSSYILLAEKLVAKGLKGEAFNFSCEHPISVLDLVKKIYTLSGNLPNFRVLNQARYEIKKQYLSAGKARRVLGWKPRYSLDQGLKLSLAWYKNYLKGA